MVSITFLLMLFVCLIVVFLGGIGFYLYMRDQQE